MVFFNRGAEPFYFDPLAAAERKKNAHLLVLGPSGAGKSAMLIYLLQQVMARHRPRHLHHRSGRFVLRCWAITLRHMVFALIRLR